MIDSEGVGELWELTTTVGDDVPDCAIEVGLPVLGLLVLGLAELGEEGATEVGGLLEEPELVV